MALNSPLPELFNYNKGHHHSSSFEEPFDTYTTAFSSLFANSNDCNSSSTDLMMNYAFTPNILAYSSSSVLNFDQPEYNSSPDQEECNLRRDSTDQNNFNVEEYIINDSNVKQNKTAQKRQFEGGDEKIDKRQCGKNRKPKAKASDSDSSSPLKDPQSLAAKNRRERISERLKVLQELIPNGTKVDLVTMLEKAVGYVKFLQLQVKVLASDEFWPTQGKKAPNISQVSEALDAILSSQRA